MTTRALPRQLVVGMRGGPAGRIALHLVVLAAVVVWLVPTAGLLVNSFRTSAALSEGGWWSALSPPLDLTLSNYEYVLGRQGLGNAFVNSLIITIPAALIPIAIAAFTAYAFAWMRFPVGTLAFLVIVMLQVVPIQTTLVPILKM